MNKTSNRTAGNILLLRTTSNVSLNMAGLARFMSGGIKVTSAKKSHPGKPGQSDPKSLFTRGEGNSGAWVQGHPTSIFEYLFGRRFEI